MSRLSARVVPWLPATLTAFLLVHAAAAQDDLARGFQDPPAVARPHTWWHWMNGNVTKEGITADLLAMKAVGLGGAQIFNVSESIPKGPVLFMSAEWRALFKHAVAEADRLGLELCMHDCAGWSSSGGPWIRPEHAMQEVVMAEARAIGPVRLDTSLPQPKTRHGFYRDIAVLAFPALADDKTRIKDIRRKAGYEAHYGQDPRIDDYPAGAVIPRDRIVDLTSKVDANGRIEWDVPAGEWTIVRLGHTPTGAVNAPAPDSGRGLECDKLSRAGMDAHWAGMMAPVLQDLGPLAGRTLRNVLIDSYEVGHQNWTTAFRAEFTRRRGYDPLPWLPVMTGRVVENGAASERFLWDLRRTIGDLFADEYYSYFSKRCHDAGLLASVEPYDGPFECLQVGRDADITMGEFWVGGGESSSCKLAASVAHVWSKRIVGAEAFTAEPGHGKWLNHPFALKAVGDLMYTTGINRYIVHRYAHQPWLDRVPGMTMGQWGTHFERTTTWWKQSPAWLQYLSRCQYLLQQGRFVADVLHGWGDAPPNGAPLHPECKGAGYDYDSCGADAVLNLTVSDKSLVNLRGMRWRVLVLPDSTWMTMKLLGRIRALVEDGATVIGRRPERSPSLSERGENGAGAAALDALARAMWGDCDGDKVKEHAFGNGRVVWGRSVPEVLAELKVAPDFAVADAARHKVAWIHRVDGETDIWFVSNQKPRADDVECTFRVSGKQPELWHPDTGAIEPAAIWNDDGKRTTVPIRFDPAGSVFVVFRAPSPAVHLTRWTPPEPPRERRPKIEIRSARYEAVDGTGGADVTAKVAALVAAGETSILANNATFGDPAYLHVKRLRIEFAIDGKAATKDVAENGALELVAEVAAAALDWMLVTAAGGGIDLHVFGPGTYRFAASDSQKGTIETNDEPRSIGIEGPWSVSFPPGLGAPARVTLPKLVSWTEHEDPGVRWFSGSAEYVVEFDVPADALGSINVVLLDLGRVAEIAEVKLNARDLGTWWKPPYTGDVTGLVRAGRNRLEVRVTNLWVNRLIGDEQLPDDCEWNGITLKTWPSWLLEREPRPSKDRVTFTTWKHWNKDAQPLPSGLIGPVVLRFGTRMVVLGSRR